MKRAILGWAAVFAVMLSIPGAAVRADDATTAPSAGATAAAADAATATPQKFYGTITAVDVAAKTFTIDDQTYMITDSSKMTKAADGSEATIADATVGEPARGTYEKNADGKMEVKKARFGRKSGGGKKHKQAATEPAAQ